MKASQKTTTGQKESFGRVDFLGLAKIFVPLSSFAVIGSLIYIAVFEFNYGVDFAGGTEMQVHFQQPVETGKVRSFLEGQGFPDASVQAFEGGNEYLIRIEPIQAETAELSNRKLNETIQKLSGSLTTAFVSEAPKIERVDSVGPQVGAELKRNGILAAFYSLLFILIYIWLRFDVKFAPAAVVTLFHDSIVVCGIYAVMGWEMNVQTLAAILTIIGYSLNDTIVVFDRIRENEKVYPDYDLGWVCNRAMNDTLARTILTSATTFLAVVVMWAFAGGVIKDFAMTMAIGVIIGCYSTIYVATPFVLLVDNLEKRRKA